MEILVKGLHLDLTPALTAHAQEKLGNSIMRVFDRPAGRISIELVDLGHLRNRSNKECRVAVFMPGGKKVFITETDDDMYKAIDLAHHRLLLQVNRQRSRANKATRNRKLARRDRELTARLNLTAEPEMWEKELREYESAHSHV